MVGNLSDRQKEIIQKLYGAGSAQDLLQRMLAEQLSFREIEEVCLGINDEFLMRGLLPDFEPSEYGLEPEALLDIVNRQRLRPEANSWPG